MELFPFFKSVLDQDFASVVLCNLDHTIIYMNPAAIRRYSKYGGSELLGKSLLACHNPNSQEKILQTVAWFQKSPSNNIIFTHHNPKDNKDVYMVALRDETQELIGYYEKHEYRDLETAQPYEQPNPQK